MAGQDCGSLSHSLGAGRGLNLALQNMGFAPDVLSNWNAGERVLTICHALNMALCSGPSIFSLLQGNIVQNPKPVMRLGYTCYKAVGYKPARCCQQPICYVASYNWNAGTEEADASTDIGSVKLQEVR